MANEVKAFIKFLKDGASKHNIRSQITQIELVKSEIKKDSFQYHFCDAEIKRLETMLKDIDKRKAGSKV